MVTPTNWLSEVDRPSTAEHDLPLSKVCPVCGRHFSYRKKWENVWLQVRYCSTRCRGKRVNKIDLRLEAAILGLLKKRKSGYTICPSEAARYINPTKWRQLMPNTHDAARRLAIKGVIEITRGGVTIDASVAHGPSRLKLVT